MPSQSSTYTFEDLSGITSKSADPNPYNALIDACQNDAFQIQQRYETHRITRETQQREKLLSESFTGVAIDEILKNRLDEEARAEDEKTGYKDPRHCLVFWARPPQRVRDLIATIQQKLQEVAPHLWLMPTDNLHMTALEVTHSLTAPEIANLVEEIRPKIMNRVVDWPYHPEHRARLVKPKVTYDAAAMALSFLPAAYEESAHDDRANKDQYSYHHLRRDLWELTSKDSKTNAADSEGGAVGVHVASRYVVPSAHLTIGRFISQQDVSKDGSMDGEADPARVKTIIEKIEEINEWLELEFWPSDDAHTGHNQVTGEWVVGEERGLDFRAGTLWYGDGTMIKLGRGF